MIELDGFPVQDAVSSQSLSLGIWKSSWQSQTQRAFTAADVIDTSDSFAIWSDIYDRKKLNNDLFTLN
jgi:hypothetical protein